LNILYGNAVSFGGEILNKIVCQKCGEEISNDFGVSLTFCANCGESLTNLSNKKTLSLEKDDLQPRAIKRQFPTIILTSLLTAFFLFIFFAAGLYFYLPQKSDRSDDAIKPTETPESRWKLWKSVSASEISKITYSTWSHRGLLSKSDGYVSSSAVMFSNEGTGTKTTSTNYDNGKRADKTDVFNTSITAEQFQQLAETVAANDFLNEPDSTKTISEGGATLTVTFSGGEKVVETSNIGIDTPEIKAILQAIDNLQNQVSWKPTTAIEKSNL